MQNHVTEEQRLAIEATIGYDSPASPDSPQNATNRATTAPNLVSQSMPNLHNTHKRSGNDDSSHVSIAGGFTRGELPKTLPIKVLNAGRLQEALHQTKEKITKQAIQAEAAETAKRQRSQSPGGRGHGGKRSSSGSPPRTGEYDDDFEDGGQQQQQLHGKKKSSTFEDDDERVFKTFPYDKSPGNNKTGGGGGGLVHGGMQSDKSMFLPTKDGEFRREYSGDHPLAPGGKGNYKKEVSSGQKPAGTGGAKLLVPGSALTPTQASAKVEKLTLAAQVKVVDPQRQLEQLRREQNEALMRVLEEEKSAEEARERMSRAVMSEVEASRLEMVFAEERRRASERIVRLTKEHEERIKEAVLSQMALSSKGKAKQVSSMY